MNFKLMHNLTTNHYLPFKGLGKAGLCSLILVILFLTGVSLFYVLRAQSGQLGQLKDGYFMLSAPITISHRPLVRVERGKVKFHSPSSKKTSSQMSGLLPNLWTEIFTAEKLRNIQLDEAKIIIDFRKSDNKNSGTISSVVQALQNSSLSNLVLQNSHVKILHNHIKPFEAFIKSGKFNVDLQDAEFEGSGEIDVKGLTTEFSLDYDFSALDEKGISVGELEFTLENSICTGQFKGLVEGRRALHLKGETSVTIADAATFHDWVSASPASPGIMDKVKALKSETTLPITINGTIGWAGDDGSLSKGKFLIGDSTAHGNLAVKLGPSNPEISGTIAFDKIDFTQLFSHSASLASEDPKTANLPLYGIKEGLSAGMELGAIRIYSLVQNIDADLRLSASVMQFGNLVVKDAGLSVFQKQGEFIVDMVGGSLFNGQVTGLFKFDTNFPKPRWHINSNFSNVELVQLGQSFGLHPPLTGKGTYKLNLTSFGDKPDEIFENVSGAWALQMPEGGTIALDLKEFLQQQTVGSAEQMKILTATSSSFGKLSTQGHFSKGAIIADHFSLTSTDNAFTGYGRVNLLSEKLDWHIAAWDITPRPVLNKAAETKKDNKGEDRSKGVNPSLREPVTTDQKDDEAAPSLSAPLLLTCSQLTGTWTMPYYEKFTAPHLSAMEKTCPASYKYAPLKTKDHPIVPLKDAG